MSFEMRNNTAMSKRAEQLRRWDESDTAREPDYPKNDGGRRIQFSSGCVFLAACLSGERDEVLRLLQQGADIDTANTDGLTALHQACIDDNLDMVEFLVHQGADVNRQDNEGWTPLHATASCGFMSIARFLIENGANLAAVSSDGELVVDLADNERMETLLQKCIDEQGIDCDEARQSEERLMLADAKNWLRSDASEADRPHPRTGATALHVAAAKGYSKVLSLLLATRSDVDKQDNDGWTPLHAAAHWGQKDAAQMLVAALADMDIKNYAGQTIFEVADSSILRYLEELKKNNKRRDSKRRPVSQIRIDTIENHIDTSPKKVIRVDNKDIDDDKINSEDSAKNDDEQSWRRSGSLRSRQIIDISPPKPTLPIAPASPEKKESSPPTINLVKSPQIPQAPAPPVTAPPSLAPPVDSEVILRRTQSFENDEKKTVLSPVIGSPVQPPSTGSMPPPSAPAAPQSGQVRRSFVPPSRDEESETQRKANAKRARETRRSTQGVTLDEIKSAEELIKKNNLNNNSTNSAEATPSVNDRVPSLKHDPDELHVPPPAPPTSLDPSPVQITASYTLSAPPTPTNRAAPSDGPAPSASNHNHHNATSDGGGGGGSPKSPKPTSLATPTDDSKTVSATFTMPSPTQSQPPTPFGRKPASPLRSLASSGTGSPPGSPSISATITVPSTSVQSKAADLEAIFRASSSKPSSPATSPQKLPRIRSIDSPSFGKDSAAAQPPGEQPVAASADFTLHRPSSASKRSLFDLDNASSLSLADKLRNEANKYSEASSDEATPPAALSASGTVVELSKKSDDAAAASGGGASSPPAHGTHAERRPSWRLKFDSGSKFKLEDVVVTLAAPAPANTTVSTTSAVTITPQRRSTQSPFEPPTRPTSIHQATVSSSVAAADPSTNDRVRDSSSTTSTVNSTATGTSSNSGEVVTLPLRRSKTTDEDKENDKENDSRSAQATQAVIQRRRRPKRRSTGVVHVDMDDIDPDRQDGNDGTEDKESGSERNSRSRLGSTSSVVSDGNDLKSDSNENGDHIDYKALYEAAMLDNDKLKQQLKKKDEDLTNAKATVDRFANATTKNSLSELEKRERRAMERKVSEMEEELKHLEALKTENQRLKDENGALIRVISKLSK